MRGCGQGPARHGGDLQETEEGRQVKQREWQAAAEELKAPHAKAAEEDISPEGEAGSAFDKFVAELPEQARANP